MCEIAGLAPATIDKTEIEPLSALRHTLAERYAKKREQADNGSAGDTRVTPALDSFARVSPPSLISWNPTVAGIRSAASTFNRSVQAYAWRPRPHRHHADSNRTRDRSMCIKASARPALRRRERDVSRSQTRRRLSARATES